MYIVPKPFSQSWTVFATSVPISPWLHWGCALMSLHGAQICLIFEAVDPVRRSKPDARLLLPSRTGSDPSLLKIAEVFFLQRHCCNSTLRNLETDSWDGCIWSRHRIAAFCCPYSMLFLGALGRAGSFFVMVSLELVFDVASGVIFPPRAGLVWRSSPPPIDVLKISIAMASTDRSIFHPFWSYYDGIARCFTCRNLECRNVFVYLRFTTFYNQATFTLSLFFCYLFWRAWIRSWKLSAEEQDGLPCIAVREKPWCRRPHGWCWYVGDTIRALPR